MSDLITDALKNEGLKNWKRIQHESRLRYMRKRTTRAKNKRLHARPAKIKRKRLPTLSALKRKADALFSTFIRNRDKKCVLCNSTTNLTNGHLIKRGNMGTRYDELNCHCLCSKCNFKDWKVRSYHDFYVSWFIKKYGSPSYLSLMDRIGVKQMKRLDYLEIIDRYGVFSK